MTVIMPAVFTAAVFLLVYCGAVMTMLGRGSWYVEDTTLELSAYAHVSAAAAAVGVAALFWAVQPRL